MSGYLTKLETIAIDGVADLQIRSLLDRNQFSDPLGDAARLGISSAAWPMFGLLWPSGAFLAARLALRPVRAGERILEIGCGLALASLVGHRRGADITASDVHPLAEIFLQDNLRLNGLGPMAYRHGNWRVPAAGSFMSEALADDAPVVSAGDAAPPGRRVVGRFDLIIGSDLLYERDAQGDAAAFIGHHAAPNGEVWIVDPDRGNRPAFNRRMAGLGFAVHEERLDRRAAPGVDGYKGRLLVYRRGAERATVVG